MEVKVGAKKLAESVDGLHFAFSHWIKRLHARSYTIHGLRYICAHTAADELLSFIIIMVNVRVHKCYDY